MTTPTLFHIHRPQRVLKRTLGRLLNTANAGLNFSLGHYREEFYGLKRRLLERYGDADGTDWQEITRPCWGCGDCRDDSDYGYFPGRRDGFLCGGSKVFSRKFIPLARTILGGFVFHTPGISQQVHPGVPIKIMGTIRHREVSDEDARAAFLQLCLMFDRELFRRVAARLFAVEPIETPF